MYLEWLPFKPQARVFSIGKRKGYLRVWKLIIHW